MATLTVTTGSDVTVRSDAGLASSALEGQKGIFIRPSDRYALLVMPVSVPAGRTVLSATLTGVARATFAAAGNITVQAISATWSPSKVTWNNKPGVTGLAYPTAVPAVAAGGKFQLDVTALVQAIALGQANYGWRISTDIAGGIALMAFEEAGIQWQLDVVTSDAIAVPGGLSPQGKISLAKWVVQVDDYDQMAAMQVQVDATGVAPFDFDTGERAVTVSELDLSQPFARTASVTTTSSSTTVTAPTATFDAGDVGASISGTGIPAGATITAVASTTSVTISAAATASGTVTATITRTYAGLADGAATLWRVRVKTLDGQWSPWSDWVSVTRGAKPALTVTAPAAGALYDPTPTVTASLSPAGTVATRWQVTVAKTADPTVILYDSGDDLTGTTLSHTVPATWKGRKVMDVDTGYRIVVRAWDDPQRVPSYGDPVMVQVTRDVTLDADGTVNAPTGLTAVQNPPGSPRVKLTWTQATAADQFRIIRDGATIAVVVAADVLVSGTTYSWTDEGALPWEQHFYQVRGITSGRKQSPDSNTATITPEVEGLWLLTKYGDVLLYGDGIDSWRQDDKRVTFELPYHTEDVDIITAVGGYAGDYEGSIDNRGEQDVDWARGVLEKVRQSPQNPVRLVAATLSISAYLKALSVSPSSDIFPDRNRRHTVAFRFSETEDE